METDNPPTGVFPFVIMHYGAGVYKMLAGDIEVERAVEMYLHGHGKICGAGNIQIDNDRREIEVGSAIWPDILKERGGPKDLQPLYIPAPQSLVERLVGNYAASIGYAHCVRMDMLLE
ncbi:MAG TPA: hypothetical protein HA362_01880 [Nanoarchaeota archaeon]|nr:hypothetical protein [Nanoarchaeota archaeon]